MDKRDLSILFVLKWILKKFIPQWFPSGIKVGDGRLVLLRQRLIRGLELNATPKRKDILQLFDCMCWMIERDTYIRRLFFYMIERNNINEIRRMDEIYQGYTSKGNWETKKQEKRQAYRIAEKWFKDCRIWAKIEQNFDKDKELK